MQGHPRLFGKIGAGLELEVLTGGCGLGVGLGKALVAELFAGSPFFFGYLKSGIDHLVGRDVVVDAMTLVAVNGMWIFLVEGIVVGVEGAEVMNILILVAVAQLAPKPAIVGTEPYIPDRHDSPYNT